MVCLIVPLFAGCAALSQGHGTGTLPAQSVAAKSSLLSNKEAPKLAADKKTTVVPKPPQPGLIAGKTEFRGLLKAPYVRLLIVKRDDPAKQFFFYVGSKGNQSVVPWGEERSVEPGYFTLELSPGAYKITQIAIPVGSTIADEKMELDFEVLAGKAVYVGTLDVDGTGEKVKFGGVPLIKPGFTYHLVVRDEMDAADVLRGMLPASMSSIEKRLFNVVSAVDDGLPPTENLKPEIRK